MKLRTLILGSVAALGLSVASAKAADLEDIADFALNICDAVNATGITISSADHCMKFSGEFYFEKSFDWLNGSYDGESGWAELSLTIEVLGDSDFGVTRGWLKLFFEEDSCEDCWDIEEIGISIGNATVLATGVGASIWNADQDALLTALLGLELEGGPDTSTAGVYVSVTHDLGNGWSVAKSIECIESCGPLAFLGVVSYDNEGITGHMSVAFAAGAFQGLHSGIQAELDNFTVQGAISVYDDGEFEVNGSIKATLDIVTLAGGFAYTNHFGPNPDWVGAFSATFDAGEFTIWKAFLFDDDFDWIFAAEISTSLSDNLALAAGFKLGDHTYDAGFDTGDDHAIADVEGQGDWSVYKKLTWTPGGGYEATAKATLGYDVDSGDTFVDLTGTTKLTF